MTDSMTRLQTAWSLNKIQLIYLRLIPPSGKHRRGPFWSLSICLVISSHIDHQPIWLTTNCKAYSNRLYSQRQIPFQCTLPRKLTHSHVPCRLSLNDGLRVQTVVPEDYNRSKKFLSPNDVADIIPSQHNMWPTCLLWCWCKHTSCAVSCIKYSIQLCTVLNAWQ